jgi:hypothetical protein
MGIENEHHGSRYSQHLSTVDYLMGLAVVSGYQGYNFLGRLSSQLGLASAA